jgi:hypothetical protein
MFLAALSISQTKHQTLNHNAFCSFEHFHKQIQLTQITHSLLHLWVQILMSSSSSPKLWVLISSSTNNRKMFSTANTQIACSYFVGKGGSKWFWR